MRLGLDLVQGFLKQAHIRRLFRHHALGDPSVVGNRRQWLIYLMGHSGCHFTHGGQARGVGQLVTLFLHQVESELSAEHRQMLQVARNRETALEGRNVLVVEDDVRNVFALSSILEPTGIRVEIARNGLEALQALERAGSGGQPAIDLVLMDIMMPEMDGYTAMREIRNRPEWRRLPIIALTAKAMKDDQEKCLAAGANDYIAKPLDVEKLLSLVRVWMPK